ncbi:MAG: double-strand break repair protein AddB [Alphaproteobacteria bacterium]
MVHSIPPGRSFVDSLARGLLRRSGSDPLALAATLVLLPNRRACRALTGAFLRATGGRPIALPAMRPLGDVDETELDLRAEDEPGGPGAIDLPPAISPLRRRLLLTRAVMRLEETTPEQAARLAEELARLLDSVQIERLSFDGLAGLVPERYAGHWQVTLRFLQVLTRHWPAILDEEQALDPAERRNRLIEAQAAFWRAHPPTHPVIAAGSTGTVPATADLLAVVARLPDGAVVLPGLDPHLDEAGWAALDDPSAEAGHPQHALKRLLARLGVDRGAVTTWDDGEPAGPDARARLLSSAMRPAAATAAWRADPPEPAELAAALNGVTRVDAAGTEEEARAIALMMRAELERPEGNAVLVTPDRALARRVAAELRRWDVEVDDSAGLPLGDTPPGSFLRLLAQMAGEEAAPVPLLALLKHPLAAGGLEPGTFRRRARALELAALRGPRPEPGLHGLRATIRREAEQAARTQRGERRRRLQGAESFVRRLERLVRPFTDLVGQRRVPVAELVRAHVAAAEALARSAGLPEGRALWTGEAGETAARFVAELLAAADGFDRIAGRDYPGLFEALLAGTAVRRRWGRHPRLAIWGPLEARLQHVDHLILGGLNEGTWPPEAPADPWMSRPMRADFGLPPVERKVGLSAHDFVQAFGAPRVTLTRAMRVEGAPTVPSRWLMRLDAVLRAAGHQGPVGVPERWLGWADALDRPTGPAVPIAPPCPRPDVRLRPRRLSVTQIETWIRDPYAIYARHVLRLRVLDPLDAEPGAPERGEFIHVALDRFLRAWPEALPPDATERLVAIGREVFAPLMGRPGVEAFWWPRFERIAAWFVDQERERRTRPRTIWTERRGLLTLDAPGGRFELTGTADRIDRLTDGRLAIVDYKTGILPPAGQVAAGAAPQLALEGAIARDGGFEGVPAGPVSELDYWRLGGGDPAGVIRPAAGRRAAPADLTHAAAAGLAAYVAAFDRRETPYLAQPRPELAPRFADYAHLARVAEWGRGAEDGG